MDEHTFLVNRERAVDYLNSLDKVILLFFSSFTILFITRSTIFFPYFERNTIFLVLKIHIYIIIFNCARQYFF